MKSLLAFLAFVVLLLSAVGIIYGLFWDHWQICVGSLIVNYGVQASIKPQSLPSPFIRL